MGDSTAVALGGAFAEWATAQEGEVEFASIARIGCGLIRGATIVGDPEKEEEARAACDAVLDDSLPRILAATPPDVVVVLVTLPDVVERIWQRSEGEFTPSDPVYVERLSADYRLFVEGCLTAGVDHVLWTVPVPPTKSWLRFVTNPIEADDWSIMVAAIRSVAAETNGSSLLDLAAWSDAVDPGAGLRPDGLHFDAEAAERVVLEAYAPTILDLLAD